MKRLFAIIAASAALWTTASLADGIGLSAPLTGTSEILGQQMKLGAEAAARTLNAELIVQDDACTAEGGAQAAKAFVERQVTVVIGYLCTPAIEAALPILKDANIPVVTIGVRTDSLTDRREKTGWQVFRMGPRGDSERTAAATILSKLWRDALFAVVDDGTIYGRELSEAIRLALEQAALKPVFVDTYRPQGENQVALIGRLRRAGATSVFVGGERDDIAIMGRDAKARDYQLIIAGGEALRAAPGDVPLADGTLMVALPEWSEIADQTALQAIGGDIRIVEGYALPAYAAMQVAVAAGATARDKLATETFSTAIGPVRFDAKGDLTENPYRLFRFEGGRFVPVPIP